MYKDLEMIALDEDQMTISRVSLTLIERATKLKSEKEYKEGDKLMVFIRQFNIRRLGTR